MPSLLFRGTVKAGQFKPDDLARWAGRLARLEGKRVQCSVKREQARRTISQNAYLWAVVYPTLAEWSGHEVAELHEHFKSALLSEPEEKSLPNGDKLRRYPSTAGLDVGEFSAYVDGIVQWAAKQGVYIPEASEVTA